MWGRPVARGRRKVRIGVGRACIEQRGPFDYAWHGNDICTLYNPLIWSRSRNLGLFECYLADVVVNALVAQAFYFSTIAAKYDGGEITQEPFSGIRQLRGG